VAHDCSRPALILQGHCGQRGAIEVSPSLLKHCWSLQSHARRPIEGYATYGAAASRLAVGAKVGLIEAAGEALK
jgi:hypothetical protein